MTSSVHHHRALDQSGHTIDPDVSVVIPSHDVSRFHTLAAVVDAVGHQSVTPAAIVVVIDHDQEMYELCTRELTGVTVLRNEYTPGVSGNRNTGAFHTDTPLIAFIDDDTVPPRHWLERLRATLTEDETGGVIGAGGALEPHWQRRPGWVPAEFLWAFGGSYSGLPTQTAPVRNVWSANMMVRRDVFTAVGGFRTDFGKIGGRARPEDTELCLRMAHASGGVWMYVPAAAIGHHVPVDRSTVRYFLARTYHEGRGKIAMARLLPGHRTLGAESRYLRSLPRAVGRGLADKFTGRDEHGHRRAAAVVGGFAAAAVGGAMELMPKAKPRAKGQT